MFRFAHSEYLHLLYIIPVLMVALWFLYRKQSKLLETFTNKKLLKILSPERSRNKFYVRSFLVLFILALLILSLANPQIGTKYEEVKQTGIDVFILLDVSLSMKAEDVKPNRIEAAKHSIGMLIEKLRGDRIGMVVFSGAAFVQFPLTTDYAAANLLLNAINFNTVPQQGTAIAEAIRTATKSFREDAKTEKVIIVITDGEDHEGDITSAVNEATEKGIKIYTIGLGSQSGVPIPLGNQSGQTAYKTDNQGNIVLTRLDELTLEQIANDGNGKYYHGTSGGNELESIYNDLSKLEKTEFGTTRVTDYEDRFYYLLAPAILLLLFEFFFTEKRSALLSKLFKKLGIESE
ncbi:MAG: VWA domain-containing protein [Ignavibacteriales bacterium]|nr:MAG: VWA domain-containing protein [Ignavibacteriales bacterium]